MAFKYLMDLINDISQEISYGEIASLQNFSASLNRERARCDRNGLGFSVALFKLAPTADIAQVMFMIESIKKNVRSTDEFGWYDHESIGILLYNTPPTGAWDYIGKIEKLIKAKEIPYTCSIVTYPDEWLDDHANDDPEPPADPEASPTDKKSRSLSSKSLARETPLKMPTGKRILDLVGSAIGLVLLLPLFLLIGLFIKIVSPGPVFFRQQRVGYGGKEFELIKFRTMKPGADTRKHRKLMADYISRNPYKNGKSLPMAKLDDDRQIIPFGRFLRKTCIDELPQLINVFRGEMSLVGPRPPIPYEVEVYKQWHRGRFNILPGITGLWQVSGKNRLTFYEMIQLDIRYSRMRSMLLDLKILSLTPYAVFSQIIHSFRDKKEEESPPSMEKGTKGS